MANSDTETQPWHSGRLFSFNFTGCRQGGSYLNRWLLAIECVGGVQLAACLEQSDPHPKSGDFGTQSDTSDTVFMGNTGS
jgi:hypothetical protein